MKNLKGSAVNNFKGSAVHKIPKEWTLSKMVAVQFPLPPEPFYCSHALCTYRNQIEKPHNKNFIFNKCVTDPIQLSVSHHLGK